MYYEIAQVRDGRYYLRNNKGEVSQFFDSEEEAEMAAFKQTVKWEYID
jgi:hypothetical protein